MLDGKIQPSDAISMLSTRLLDGKDRVIYTAARTLSNSNTPVDAKSVINYIKKEIWASDGVIEDYTNYINCLSN